MRRGATHSLRKVGVYFYIGKVLNQDGFLPSQDNICFLLRLTVIVHSVILATIVSLFIIVLKTIYSPR